MSTLHRGRKREKREHVRSSPSKTHVRYQGRNRVFFSGRIVTGRSLWTFLATHVFILLPVVPFTIFVCPWLWRVIGPAVPVIYAYLFLLACTSMYRASLSDPGIIPRGLEPDPPRHNLDVPEASESIHIEDPYSSPPQDSSSPPPRDIKVRGQLIQVKYCDTCEIYRPPRASHCRTCDNCVEDHDHHCLWLNNCVGKRNYRFFISFIFSTSILALYIMGFALYRVISAVLDTRDRDLGQALKDPPVAVALAVAIYVFLLIWGIGGLTFYHIWLITHNRTTHEQMRASAAAYNSPEGSPPPTHPFDTGNPLRNCARVLCVPIPSSHVDWQRAALDRGQLTGV
ncbi:MAG: DHHC palmitoyltransferase-domain-containing protein [Piptocephalis tieghemiana]|nr:MAG: DHHC palmitoyltransferase-domain-containing protein [Piptocephalis tieghemiana]